MLVRFVEVAVPQRYCKDCQAWHFVKHCSFWKVSGKFMWSPDRVLFARDERASRSAPCLFRIYDATALSYFMPTLQAMKADRCATAMMWMGDPPWAVHVPPPPRPQQPAKSGKRRRRRKR